MSEAIHWAARKTGKQIEPLIDGYVVAVLAFSIFAFLCPSYWLAAFSAYFSFSTIVVLLNIVLQNKVFGEIASPERSILLFMCNVPQIIFMFATWYHLCGQEKPLLTSTLTFATISHAGNTPNLAMLQIATDFILVAIFLSHLVGQVGRKSGSSNLSQPVNSQRIPDNHTGAHDRS